MVFEKTDLYYRKYAINIVQFNYFSEANGMSIGRNVQQHIFNLCSYQFLFTPLFAKLEA